MSVIEAENLAKIFRVYKKKAGFWGGVQGLFHREYEEIRAVDSVRFSVAEGELVGFLGPNGAGKTTVLKMLSGLLFPTSGKARVLGFVPWERADEYRRQFSLVMGQKNQLWWDLPARESFELNREIYAIERPVFEQKLDELTALLDVKEKLNVMVRELSLGERMKMELIAALLHSPRVLLLDEPTIGLDVVSQKRVREFIREYNRNYRVTILLTSHYMTDIEELCERVIIIHRGKIFFDGKLAEIVNRFAGHKILHLVCREFRTAELPASLGETLERRDGMVRLKVPRARVASVCHDLFVRYPIEDISIEEAPIEDIIREIFGQEG
ncbi:MAG: ATP-binding cassette domain-containing protein [Verrucomicrobia bacterium]|nr:ATP-binding cassette domain-containing protein [Verrucomicrobiota bacterium]